MDKIKNIIFDLGGVVIDLKRERAVAALEKLGIEDAGTLLGEYSQKGPFLKLETGEISSSEFFDLLQSKCLKPTGCTQIRDAFEEFLVGIPIERLKLIEELKKQGFKTYVLSNTNPIMFNHWIQREFKKDGKSINDYFDGIVASFQEGVCKPDSSIFINLIKRYQLNPGETLMLDDSEKNVMAARSVGLKAQKIEAEGENSFHSVCKNLLKSQ